MGWLLANFLLLLYGVSPLIVTVLYGIGIVNGGRAFAAIGVVLFVLTYGGHIVALSAIRKTSASRKTFHLPTICVDVGLFLIHFLLTAGGVTIGIINVTTANLQCHVEISFPPYNSSYAGDGIMNSQAYDKNVTPNPNDDNSETNGYCGVDIALFFFTILMLCIRCWNLPIIIRLRTYTNKKR